MFIFLCFFSVVGIWVIYGDGVYDVTSFYKHHPGGHDKLEMVRF